ncbi:hypothetical protein [Arthrobacter sp. AQ5-05]|uniref:hypothetical protein n=1 Tax=Arthrobacter sp. AQ5-05 TaxID=2184581 RepID=UPI002570ACC4|nr:hypothetical protein [Arthrobacter sp. AQ5-05]
MPPTRSPGWTRRRSSSGPIRWPVRPTREGGEAKWAMRCAGSPGVSFLPGRERSAARLASIQVVIESIHTQPRRGVAVPPRPATAPAPDGRAATRGRARIGSKDRHGTSGIRPAAVHHPGGDSS